jgi:SAM-dependent methyltransferase
LFFIFVGEGGTAVRDMLPSSGPVTALKQTPSTLRPGYDRIAPDDLSPRQTLSAPKQTSAPAPVDLVTYYTEAGMDYRAWSRSFNMHFLDLGCGLGAPTRALIRQHDVAVTAVTKVEWQLAMAQKLSQDISKLGTVDWKLGDFTALDLPGGAFQRAFSIEASCHAEGADKEPFVRECSRLLAPGAKLVVADGFMKRSAGLPRWYATLLGYMTRNWAVERFADLPAFCACLERHGLTVLAAEDISWRIAPSVVHVPRVTLKFLAGELLLRRKRLNSVRWGHILACVLAPFIGLGRRYFGYYLVTAQKR